MKHAFLALFIITVTALAEPEIQVAAELTGAAAAEAKKLPERGEREPFPFTPQVQISARYEGFDRSLYADIIRFDNDLRDKVSKSLFREKPERGSQPAKKAIGTDVLTAPQVTTRQGQRCQIEIIREVQVPETPNGEKSVNTGVALDLLPLVKDGKITLSGKSVLRRRVGQNAVQPLSAMSFAAHETFFSGEVEDGKELTVAVGDGPKDKARIILSARLVNISESPAK